MAKQKSKDNSCYSFSALVRQLLLDSKPHTVEDIAGHVQKFMLKTSPISVIRTLVKGILEQDKDLHKSKNGFVLKSGTSIIEQIERLISEADQPLQKDDIIKLVAKEQNVPPEAVDIDLDADKRFASVAYKGKNYYFLAGRKKVNDKVYEILKAKGRSWLCRNIQDS